MIKNDLNPNWNEELTLAVPDPPVPLKLVSEVFLFVQNFYYLVSLACVLSQRCLIVSFFLCPQLFSGLIIKLYVPLELKHRFQLFVLTYNVSIT